MHDRGGVAFLQEVQRAQVRVFLWNTECIDRSFSKEVRNGVKYNRAALGRASEVQDHYLFGGGAQRRVTAKFFFVIPQARPLSGGDRSQLMKSWPFDVACGAMSVRHCEANDNRREDRSCKHPLSPSLF